MALAKWYKVDFHTHTPASNCFPDKSVTADQWLKAAKDSGMNAVVITDHNSVAFARKIDEVKANYEKENEFKIFYGIELCVSAEFTHFIIIFDDSLTVTQIEDAIISELGLTRDNWGNTEINISEDKLKKLCLSMPTRIFVIPAHFASNKGLGTVNINAIKKYQEFVNFSAIEVRNEDDEREYNNKVTAKVINQAVKITGSDNPSNKNESQHSIEGFGKMYTWVKLSKLNFEGLRQVFIDPEHRCLNWLDIKRLGINFNPNDVNHNYIAGINIHSISHLTDLNLRFSPYLNCIIGGRGTGKSTLVSAINYGLNSELNLEDCKLLKKTLLKDGKIQTYYNFGSSNPYGIIATKKNAKNLMYVYEDSKGIVENPPEFKVDFYGQKEIFNLIEDEDDITNTGESPLVKLIDGKIEAKLYPLADEINATLSELLRLSETYKNNRKKINELPSVRAELNKIESVLLKYKESGLDSARKEYEHLQKIIELCNQQIEKHLSNLEELVSGYQENIGMINEKIQNLGEDALLFPEAKEVFEALRDSYECMITIASQQKENMLDKKAKFESSNIFTEKKKAYEKYKDAVDKIKNTGSENIKDIQDKLQEYKDREEKLVVLQGGQATIESQINECINKFLNKRLQLTQLRKDIVDSMQLDNIRIVITPIAHKSRWKQNLQREFGKESVFDTFFEEVVEYILNPENEYDHYKKFIFYLLTSEEGEFKNYYDKITDSRFLNLWNDKQKNDTLSSLVKVIPEDLINIKMIEDSGEIDINEGSPGQKSAAVLAFILSSGDNPLIIDQPEDDLDNSLIYNLIVKSIRNIKSKRQIIIVTHNPNIPVLGDAEAIIVLERNAQGKVDLRNHKKAGCLEEKIIREGICEIMEGGESAFKKREEKYLYK